MDLREFVTATLRDITQGIQDAQNIEGVGGLVAPSSIGSHEFPVDSGVSHNSRITSTVVKFDVAVTAEETATGGARAGVKVLGLSWSRWRYQCEERYRKPCAVFSAARDAKK